MQKKTNNKLPPFPPILLAISTTTYKLGKPLLPFLTHLTKNEYTVKDSFHFAEEICKQEPHFYMASLDDHSLFTNIPLLYNNNEKISKDVFL